MKLIFLGYVWKDQKIIEIEIPCLFSVANSWRNGIECFIVIVNWLFFNFNFRTTFLQLLERNVVFFQWLSIFLQEFALLFVKISRLVDSFSITSSRSSSKLKKCNWAIKCFLGVASFWVWIRGLKYRWSTWGSVSWKLFKCFF